MTRVQLNEAMKAGLPIISRLEEAGYEAVFVGGAVRDSILGRTVKDVDIATSAKPEQVMALFPKCIPTGIAHGTVTVMHEGTAYEVTTYRRESEYTDHRKPKEVSFETDLKGDLLRRDFTVNAMALRSDGSVYDPFGGLDDLNNGILRCVGHANERFHEDALRMVRAVRFIGVYGFRPAFSTWRALIVHRELLRHVAMERIQAELDKMLESRSPARCLAWLRASGLLRHTKTPLGSLIGSSDLSLSPADLSRLHHISETDIRWSYVGIAAGIAADDALEALEALRMSNKRIQRITTAIRFHDEMDDILNRSAAVLGVDERGYTEADIYFIQLFLKHGEIAAVDWLLIMNEVLQSSGFDHTDDDITRMERFSKLLSDAPLRTVKELDLNGAELTAALGKKAGPWLKEYLDMLLLETVLGRLENQKEALVLQAAAWQEEEREKQS